MPAIVANPSQITEHEFETLTSNPPPGGKINLRVANGNRISN